MSSIEQKVIDKIVSSAKIGQLKYGVTMDRDDLDLKAWATHALEEALDFAIYLQKIIDKCES